MNGPLSFLNTQSILFALWLVSLALSVVLYGGVLVDAFRGVNLCGYPGMGEGLWAFIQPKNWLGIFTLLLTGVGLLTVARAAVSKWAILDKYKWVAGVGLIFLVAVSFGFGCR